MSISISIDKQNTTFDRWTLIGVFTIWASMMGTILGCIALYARNIPWREDWYMVPALVGKEASLFEWLWTQNMEHRLPLQKAVYLLLLKVSDGDFRSAIVANALTIGTICFTMIMMARHLRGGQTRLADAFFPLVFLHFGNLENIMLGWQIQFVVSTALICFWLMIIVGSRFPLSPRIAVTAGLILVLLPLSGGNG